MGFNNNLKKPDLKRISDVIWEIDPSFKEGMRVPARLYATDKLINHMDLSVFDQITNVATLPGIQKYAYCMPDGHSGYGFPIGGLAAMDINDGGVISPGGIGFDINCLAGDSEILSEHGFRTTISEMEKTWEKDSLVCMDFSDKKSIQTGICNYLKFKPKNKVYKIRTKCGHEVVATEDHPIWTPKGMVEIRNLNVSDDLASYPFKGVKYEGPIDKILISEECVNNLNSLDFDKNMIIQELKKRNLLPLNLNSKIMPYLVKLLAFLMGDGTLIFTNNSQYATFYGRKEDLELIRCDVEKLGFIPSPVHVRKRDHKINTKYGLVEFSVDEYSFFVGAKSFVVLLHLLGCPLGRKASQNYPVPQWIFESPLWYKRLFLATLFGAEMSSPKTMSKFGYNFYMPTISVNKTLDCLEDGKEFLTQIAYLLGDFNISTSPIEEVDEHVGKKLEVTKRLRLQVHGTNENLIRLYESVNYEYHIEKRFLANCAVNYLKLKEQVVSVRNESQKEAILMYSNGFSVSQIAEKLGSKNVNKRFILRSIFEGRKTSSRVPANFQKFDDYVKSKTERLENSGMVWDSIVSKEEVPFDDYVYDFTVEHNDHNFIANGLVVSNCGMRLLATNLTLKDVKPKLKELVNMFFDRVPTGVGCSGFVKIDKNEFKKSVEHGAKWAVESGYGWAEDLERTEANGCDEGADAKTVSETAIKRGFNQIGTLGSGNHYLEIQHVTEDHIFDKPLAKKWGIFPDQIVVMFHCGSRGFGHQVATDYLQSFLSVMETKFKIKILDRELACAPFDSKEGQDYFSAMKCAVNMSFANRQTIAHRIREVFAKVFNTDAEKLGMHQIYDIAHNRASLEKHNIDGQMKELLVHRKGATAAFGPGHSSICGPYKQDGQPVIIGGSMETGSYLLAGVASGESTFFTTAHGAGRTMSRAEAKRRWNGTQLQKDLENKGIYIKTASYAGLAEEAGGAYKEIDDVIEATSLAGISKKVVKLVPIGNIKG